MFRPIGLGMGSSPKRPAQRSSETELRRRRDRAAPLRARAAAEELLAIHLEAEGIFNQDRAWADQRARCRSLSGDPAEQVEMARQRAEIVRSIEDELLIESKQKRARKRRKSR